MRNLAFVACLLFAGCAAAPNDWTRADGRMVSPNQLALDQTICKGEMQKQPIPGTSGGGVFHVLAQQGARTDVYVGCMAQRGYIAER